MTTARRSPVAVAAVMETMLSSTTANEFITLYGHLTEVDVEIGDEVKKGDVIGKMGSTGFSTGDHLHIEIRYQGYILNPAFYLDVTQ